MAYCFLLLMGLPMFTHGFGFQVLPFQMDVQVPPFQSFPQSVFPSMNLMSFPPVFNPLEAMGREADPEARGMDVDSPMGNITTKNKTESKDGFKVTTITSDGPGFHSYIKEYESEGNATEKNGTAEGGKGPSKMPPGANIFDIMNQLRMGMEKKQRKCKKCGAEKFCDPIFHLCRKKFAEGRTCMAQKQCGKNLRCQWGKCQKAKRGDPGTFCKGNSQCSGDSCCRNTPGSFHLMCIPQQAEGAICGLHEQTESIAKVFYVVKRSIAPQCSPCKTGLKCAETGGSKYKRCVKMTYAETVAKDDMPPDESGSGDDDEDEMPTDVIGAGATPKSRSNELVTNRHTQAEKVDPMKMKTVFEAKVKPVKPLKSSAKPAAPPHPTTPANPQNPSGGEKNKDVNGEDGKTNSVSDNDKDEDEEDEGSAEDNVETEGKPIPIENDLTQKGNDKKKNKKGSVKHS